MSRHRSDRNDRLRALLRRGDPAGDRGLTTDELQAMRRTVLNAAPESRRRPLLLPAFVATCAVLLVLGFWWLRGSAPVEPPREASVAPPVAVAPAPPPEPVATIAQTTEERIEKSPAPPPVPQKEEPHSRQVQFSTPGGTRVVWVLTTEDVL